MTICRFLAIAVLGLSAGIAVWAQPTTMPTPAARVVGFAPVGVALTENMQVNLYNQASNPASGTAASCTGTVSFLDATGKAIAGTGGPFTVAAGQTQSIVLTGAKANTSTTTGSRAEVRAVISLTTMHGTPCSLVDSLEIFDATTGASHVYLQGNVLSEIPIPIPLFPPGQ